MVHSRERLALGRKTRDDLGAVHAELDQFERDLPSYRLLLLREPNRAHSAFADSFEQHVWADLGPCDLGDGR